MTTSPAESEPLNCVGVPDRKPLRRCTRRWSSQRGDPTSRKLARPTRDQKSWP